MKTTVSLDPRHLPFDEKALRRFSVVIADIDYTLVDFGEAHRAGMSAVSGFLGRRFANKVDEIFHLVIDGHRHPETASWEQRQAFNRIMAEIESLQEKFGPKVWSRETWMILAAGRLGLPLPTADLERGRDLYWQGVAGSLCLYPDAAAFAKTLENFQISLVLMTGSDSVMRIHPDGSLAYDPEYSEARKRLRIGRLPLRYEKLVIGDPVDKPEPRFFERLFREVQELGEFSRERILVAGDSIRNDLEIPGRMGCRTLLVKRKEEADEKVF